MRLERIKLAGFKSFVDPTVVYFPSNLVGIVGPNGCGKSNIIDAVRWVMGESSARLLRGESMADVIFNGSANRKPVSLASIELIFDNSDGRAGGPYAAFRQISVKREIRRDGQSIYFLNGTRCRRRDIQDLFLGTGLGPRSYAIIEQGMIARLIEARPDELRLFLEEAAGISKYKERRRETEERIHQTRENLARLDDLRREVGKQLAHLERQAALAERYTRWRAEERRLELELLTLRWQALEGERQRIQERLAAAESELLAAQVARQDLEAAIAKRRAEHRAAAETCNALQGELYALEAEIARLEQGIRYAREEHLRRQEELRRIEGELAEIAQGLEADSQRLQAIDQSLATDEPELARAVIELRSTIESGQRLEAELASCASRLESLDREAALPLEESQAQRFRLAALEQSIAQARAALERLAEEEGRLDDPGLGERLAALSREAAEIEQALIDLESEGAALCESEEHAQAELYGLAKALEQIRTQIREHKGRLASLRALQEAALSEGESPCRLWLEEHGLGDAPRLVEFIGVETPWREAVESCLGEALKAVVVDGLDRLLAGADELPPGLILVERGGAGQGPSEGFLGGRVQGPPSAMALMAGVRLSDHWRSALAARSELRPGERWMTPEGIEVGPSWIRTPGRAEGGGMIGRVEAIAALEQALERLSEQESALADRYQHQLAALSEIRGRRRALEGLRAERERERSRLQAELRALETRIEHQSERRQALAAERLRLEQQIAEQSLACQETCAQLDHWRARLESLRDQREALAGRRAELQGQLAEHRARERIQRDRLESLRVQVETNRAASQAIRDNHRRLLERREPLIARRLRLQSELAAGEAPLHEQQGRCERARSQKLEIEQRLAAAHQELTQLELAVRTLEGDRQRLEQSLQADQRLLEELRLGHQEQLVRQRMLAEQLAELGATPESVLQGLDPQATESAWQERLNALRSQIQRLGPVNLAALDEFKEQAARKAYLDAQYEDIAQALDRLEQAIRTIDRETRQRFKETYDQVNRSFQTLFPRLFGGGQASLELTDRDLLLAGVTVMARPPGKRNTSIHLLSGGEKALTAVALLFAIFELNPAPFCLLDEVDAPLDDVNVGRFCELLRAMSERVQFIFVTHNKQTMEIAEHLIGVTMQEPGVSRLVSVDIETALRLADEGSAKASAHPKAGAF